MAALCPDRIHLIAQLPTGRYACAECGAQFAEYHALALTLGVGAAPGVARPAMTPGAEAPAHG